MLIVQKPNLFVIEDFKHPDYYKYNRNVEHISVSKVLDNLENKIFFPSRIINQKNQTILMNSINQIYRYKGNLKDSDICFIEKL